MVIVTAWCRGTIEITLWFRFTVHICHRQAGIKNILLLNIKHHMMFTHLKVSLIIPIWPPLCFPSEEPPAHAWWMEHWATLCNPFTNNIEHLDVPYISHKPKATGPFITFSEIPPYFVDSSLWNKIMHRPPIPSRQASIMSRVETSNSRLNTDPKLNPSFHFMAYWSLGFLRLITLVFINNHMHFNSLVCIQQKQKQNSVPVYLAGLPDVLLQWSAKQAFLWQKATFEM